MHTVSTRSAMARLVVAGRILLASLIGAVVLAIAVPSLLHPLGWSLAASIGAVVLPLIAIVTGAIGAHRGLETTGWAALLLLFTLRILT